MGDVPTWIRKGAPDPADAGRRWERIVSAADQQSAALPDSKLARSVAAICCQRAPYLATLLARDPTRLARVANDPYLTREKPEEIFAAQSPNDAVDQDDLLQKLRSFRADELVRTGVRELEHGTAEEVGRELARLADVCFQVAIDFHYAELCEKYGTPMWTDPDGEAHKNEFVVFAMGKHGGQELNFSSDVDVIYVYRSDADDLAEPSAHQFFSKLSERITFALGEITENDCVFRVDLRLRPEGSRGAIANSLPSLERYYESWGRPWERQAWLKARPCAGSVSLGDDVLSMLEPFIFPRSFSSSVAEDVQALNQKIKTDIVQRDGVESGFDVKNGEGGIREVEFFVQAHQLIHAGQQPSLRTRSTLTALDQLLFAGIITDTEQTSLAEGYRFLRHTEHVLQLESGRQTQTLPSEKGAFDLVAKRMGKKPSAFRSELAHHTQTVAAIFATLDEKEAEVPGDILLILDGDLTPKGEEAVFARLQFRDPAEARIHYHAARALPGSPLSFASSKQANQVAPILLAEIATSPDPDQGLVFLVELIRRRPAWAAIWRLLAGNPRVSRLVASLFGTSAYLSKQFLDHPELIDSLNRAGQMKAMIEEPVLLTALKKRLSYFGPDETEAFWESMAEWKNAEVLRIGLADIGGELTPSQVTLELSKVAEVCLQLAFNRVREDAFLQYGIPKDDEGNEVTMAVLAQGKLGSRELGYASDLDVIFVYSADGTVEGPKPIENITLMTRIAQRLMGALHTLHRTGRLYEVDTRLRPSGSQGLLVSSLSAWMKYHQGTAALWEKMALTRLRAVAGDAALGESIAETGRKYIYDNRSANAFDEKGRAELAAGIHEMRERIETELGGSVHGSDVKVGRGGLIDIEFVAQFLALAYGPKHRELQTTSTIEILSQAAEAEVVEEADAQLLGEAYTFMRLLEHRMRIVHDKPVHRLPTNPEEIDKLAKRASFPDRESLERAFSNWTRDVRSAYKRVLGL